MSSLSGPLAGVKVLEVGGIGPVPFACMLLADMGAEVIRIDRPPGYDGGTPVEPRFNLPNRGRRSLALNLKAPAAAGIVLEIVSRCDVLVEGFRPGVAERLGIGPRECLEHNPALVYGRMTGWGQTGPLAQEPGHDANYISLTGALHAIGQPGGSPVLPLNLIGDYGGGSLYLAVGVLAGLLEAGRSGQGQVVDAAMVDGAASLMTSFFGQLAAGYWNDVRGTNRLDSGAPYYNVYRTRDDRWISLGANETRFWRNALAVLGILESEMPAQQDRSQWPRMRQRIADAVAVRTRDEWVGLARGRQACIFPVLSMSEAPQHPHMRTRRTFVEVDGVLQPAPAPRFDRTPGAVQHPPPSPGEHTEQILTEIGLTEADLCRLRQQGAIP